MDAELLFEITVDIMTLSLLVRVWWSGIGTGILKMKK